MKRYRSVSPPRRRNHPVATPSNKKKVRRQNRFNKASDKILQSNDSEYVIMDDDELTDDELTDDYIEDKKPSSNTFFILIMVFFIFKYFF